MTEREIADWEREIRHAEKIQEQRKSKRDGWDGNEKNPTLTTFEYLTMLTSEANNEINNQ